jgi:hypothetical protein
MSETKTANPLAELPNIVKSIMEGGKEEGNEKSLDQKLKDGGLDDASIEKIKELGLGLLGDDVTKLPKTIQDKINDQVKKSENTTKDQLYQTIEHMKEKINKLNAGLEEKAKLEEELKKKQSEEEEKKRQEKLSADEKIAEMQKNMQESLRIIKENSERESKELKQQIHIRDMEKVRDGLLREAGDIIVELIPQITPETTPDSLAQAINNAKAVTDSYRQRFGTQQQQDQSNTRQQNQGNIIPNNKGGRNALDQRELEGLVKDLDRVTDIKELDRRMKRIQEIQGII